MKPHLSFASQIPRAMAILTMVFLVFSLATFVIPQRVVISETVSRQAIPSSSRTVISGDIPSGPIYITSDEGLEIWPGSGTPGDPYRIENLNITTPESYCISIENTRAHLRIRNCTLSPCENGILLVNVTNCAIVENVCTENHIAVQVMNSTDVAVRNNIVSTGSGIVIAIGSNVATPSTRIEVRNNTCIGAAGPYLSNGIHLWNCEDVIVADNRVHNATTGIWAQDSNEIQIENNHVSCDRDVSWGVYLSEMGSASVHNNSVSGFADGLHLYNTHSAIVTNNTVGDCNVAVFVGGNQNTVENNTLSDSDTGVFIDYSASDNRFVWNSLLGNLNQAQDNGTHSIVRNNYWSDYTGIDANDDGIGDTPYPFSGSANNEDPYPLMSRGVRREPIAWNPAPVDRVFALGDTIRYDLNTTSSVAVDWSITWSEIWSVDNYLQIDSDGVLTNKTVDFHWENPVEIHVVATNIYARSVEGSFNITIQDTTGPVWVETPPSHVYYNMNELYPQPYRFVAEDVSFRFSNKDTIWWVNDTVHFSIYGGYPEGRRVSGYLEVAVVNVTSLGDIGIEVRAYDYYGHFASATILFTVRETVSPTFTGDYESPRWVSEGSQEQITLTWQAYDSHPTSYEILLNGTSIETGDWTSVDQVFTLNIDPSEMAVGVYNYTVVVTDACGNAASLSVLLIIRAASTTTTTTTVGPGPDMMIVAIGVVAVIVVLAAVAAFLKRRG